MIMWPCSEFNNREMYVVRMLKEMYEIDFNETGSEKKGMSQNDIRFMEMMKRGIIKEDGHYVLPLPLKHLEISFPSQSVKRKM